jgi:hypothetical protein
MGVYRAYCEGREFGIDYPSKEVAQAAVDRYREHFPKFRYYIRKAIKPRIH